MRDNIEYTDDYPGYYTVKGYRGIAFYVPGWITEPDEDTEWTGVENRTGDLAAIMVGDDRVHRVEPEDLIQIDEDGFCPGCGQVGCYCYR